MVTLAHTDQDLHRVPRAGTGRGHGPALPRGRARRAVGQAEASGARGFDSPHGRMHRRGAAQGGLRAGVQGEREQC